LLELKPTGPRKLVIGMIHLPPMPGTPFHQKGSFADARDTAFRSAEALHAGGADGCLVQTVDRVYPLGDECDPARLAALTLITRGIVERTGPGFHVGLHILRNALSASLAIAKVAGGSFVRAGALVGRTLSSAGLVESDPHAVMNYRAKLDAWDVTMIAEIHSMHYRWHGEHKLVGEIARQAMQAGANGVCLCDPNEAKTFALIDQVRSSAPNALILLGGYTSHANAQRLLVYTDGAFVGSCLEPEGWGGRIDVERVKAYVDLVRSIPA